MRLTSILQFLSLTALLFLTACSNNSSKQLTMSFPDWQALQAKSFDDVSANATPFADSSGGRVGLISINATSNGVTKVVYSWRRLNDAEVAPGEATFTAAKGSMIQALAVMESSGSLAFYYGDAMVGSDDRTYLDVFLRNIAAQEGLVQGTIAGQYIDRVVDFGSGPEGTGPTGEFQYRFDPDSMEGGKPAMIVETGEMYAGWVKAFSLGTKLIQYTKTDGSALMNLTDDDGLFSNAFPQRSARIVIPAGFQQKDRTFEPMPKKSVTLGYFGPKADQYASAKKLCLPTVDATKSDAPEIDGAYATYVSPNPSSKMIYISDRNRSAATPPNEARLIAPASYAVGGYTSAMCPGLPFVDSMTADMTKLSDPEKILGFYGPFRAISAGGPFIESIYSGGALNLTWKYLPRATEKLSGVTVFYRPRPVGASFDDDELKDGTQDGLACQKMADGGFPGAFLSYDAGLGTTATLPITATQATSMQIAICPRVLDGHYYKMGLPKSIGGGSGSASVDRIKIQNVVGNVSALASPVSIQKYLCVPIFVSPVDGAGNRVSPGGSFAVNFAATGSGDKLANNPTCGSAAPTLSLSNFYNAQYIYLMTTNLPGTAGTITASAPSLSTPTSTFFYESASPSTSTLLQTNAESSTAPFECRSIAFAATDAAGNSATPSGSPYTLPNIAGLDFYSAGDWNCAGTPEAAGGTFMFSGSLAIKQYNYRYTGTASTLLLNVGPPAPVVATPKTLYFASPGAASKLELSTNTQGQVGVCQAVAVNVLDSSNRKTNFTGATSIVPLGSITGTFYAASNCTGVITHTTLNAGDSRSIVYFNTAIAGTSTLQTGAAAPFAASPPVTITVSP